MMLFLQSILLVAGPLASAIYIPNTYDTVLAGRDNDYDTGRLGLYQRALASRHDTESSLLQRNEARRIYARVVGQDSSKTKPTPKGTPPKSDSRRSSVSSFEMVENPGKQPAGPSRPMSPGVPVPDPKKVAIPSEINGSRPAQAIAAVKKAGKDTKANYKALSKEEKQGTIIHGLQSGAAIAGGSASLALGFYSGAAPVAAGVLGFAGLAPGMKASADGARDVEALKKKVEQQGKKPAMRDASTQTDAGNGKGRAAVKRDLEGLKKRNIEDMLLRVREVYLADMLEGQSSVFARRGDAYDEFLGQEVPLLGRELGDDLDMYYW